MAQNERETTAKPKRSLILAGGGMRVAYQAGALRALTESGLKFDHADGTSGGTINLAMLLSGQSPAKMCERWRGLDVRNFVSLMPLGDYLRPTSLKALGSAEGIAEKVFPQLGIDFAKINRAKDIVGTFNVCDFTRKTNEVVTNDRLDRDLLIAGISLPIFMPPVRKGSSLYMDSVWIQDANCLEAVARGADEIWVIWCIGNTATYQGGAFDQYVHMIELSANGALFRELDQIRSLNEAIARGERPAGRSRPIKVHLVKPEYPLPLDPELFAGRITTGTLIDMGYRDASNYLRDLPPDGVPLTPAATRMRDPKPGVAFREMMSGPFALDESDPVAGAKRGREQGLRFVMNASIEVQDIERFANDPNHDGTITGHITFPKLGKDIPAKHGIFRLFSPGTDRDTTLMVYELGFEVDGRDYYFAGAKRVRQDPGFDLWSDTTTLYSRLHAGRDAKGRVIGAGVLTLTPWALVQMLPTIVTRNAHTLNERTRALYQFSKFFSGQLATTYLPSVADAE